MDETTHFAFAHGLMHAGMRRTFVRMYTGRGAMAFS